VSDPVAITTRLGGETVEGHDDSARLFDGVTFAEEPTRSGPAIWGRGDQVLWSPGEPFMLYGPQGVGKTTVAQRLMLGLIGVEPMVLGFPLAVAELPVLYVAADRPMQAARSWRRMVEMLRPDQHDLLRERVRFWRGPLPFDIAATPDRLVEFVTELGCGTLVGDSLKDLAVDLIKDEVGSRVNRAWQLLIQQGVEVLDLHHPRKSQAGQSDKPRSLDDVYGSTWLTTGHGSVVLLWGKPGDPIVELGHLKQPAEEVGPLRVLVDHELGQVEVHEGGDPVAILRSAPRGMAVRDVACVLFSTTKPTASEIEKTRRRLVAAENRGQAFGRREGRDDHGHPLPVVYFATTAQGVLG
jgi:replicative DNA helicase